MKALRPYFRPTESDALATYPPREKKQRIDALCTNKGF